MKNAHIGTDLEVAESFLRAGELVAIPTETVYGLAANAYDPDAVIKIFRAKNRPQFNPLILHTNSFAKIEHLTTHIPSAARRLGDKFWPGPLTLLLPRSAAVHDLVTAGSSSVAVRIPSHPLTLTLLERLDFPLAAPSANPSGYISPTSAAHVAAQLGDRIPYILDGGETSVGIESTILGFNENEEAVLYRPGGLSLEALEDIAGKIHLAAATQKKPQSPGQLKSHYAPHTPFHLLENKGIPHELDGLMVGALCFDRLVPGIEEKNQVLLSPGKDLGEAAKNLFAVMRDLDEIGLDAIVAVPFPDEGLGRAINDRLRRAAAERKKY